MKTLTRKNINFILRNLKKYNLNRVLINIYDFNDIKILSQQEFLNDENNFFYFDIDLLNYTNLKRKEIKEIIINKIEETQEDYYNYINLYLEN